MKRIHSFVPFALSLQAVLLCVFSSCVSQGPGWCVDPRGNTRVSVNVATTVEVTRATRGEVGGYRIDSAHVWVFDPEGGYVASSGGRVDEAGDWEFWLTLPGGEFDFVVWTNTGDSYRVAPTTGELATGGFTMSDMELWLAHGGEPITDTIPHLLYGIARSHTIIEGTDNHIEMEISPRTYTVNLTVLNLSRSNDQYAFTITDNNSHYTFEGELIGSKPLFTHRRTDTAPGGEFRSSIRTLTLSADRDPRFSFIDTTTGTVMHDANLIYTITRAYNAQSRAVDFETTYTYDIVLSFDMANMILTVSVNGWQYRQIIERIDIF